MKRPLTGSIKHFTRDRNKSIKIKPRVAATTSMKDGINNSDHSPMKLSRTTSKLKTSVDEHKVNYSQDASWVPKFYTRPGPGMYEVQENMTTLSKHQKGTIPRIEESNMLKGYFKTVGPKHRFTDYSKAQIAIQMNNNEIIIGTD